MKNTSARTRGPFDVPDVEERGASMRLAISLLLHADIRPDDRRYLLDMALWRLTEFDKNRYKFATRYRTREVVEGPPQDINHEHVVPRKWLLDRLVRDPAHSEALLGLAVACVVTTEEHRKLNWAHGFGWDRYRHAGIQVLDTAGGMRLLDLDEAVDRQDALLRALGLHASEIPSFGARIGHDAPTIQTPIAVASSTASVGDDWATRLTVIGRAIPGRGEVLLNLHRELRARHLQPVTGETPASARYIRYLRLGRSLVTVKSSRAVFVRTELSTALLAREGFAREGPYAYVDLGLPGAVAMVVSAVDDERIIDPA